VVVEVELSQLQQVFLLQVVLVELVKLAVVAELLP
jgi:hypothetical protein